MAQVGEPALAVGGGEHARRKSLAERDRLHQRRDAAQAEHACPLVQALVDRLPGVGVGRGDVGGRPAPEVRERDGRRARRGRGTLERLEQPQPLARRLGAEHAAGAVDDGGIPTSSSASRTSAAWRLVRTSTATSPGRTSARAALVAAQRCARRQQAHEVLGEVARDVLARIRALARSPCGSAHRRLRSMIRSRSAASTGAPTRRRLAVALRRLDLPVDDPRMTEPRAAEERVVGVEQCPGRCASSSAASRVSRRRRRPPGTRRRRRRGRRRSPASGRRSARAWSRRRRTRGGRSTTGPGRCPGTRRPARP